jgi:thymidylate kinase
VKQDWSDQVVIILEGPDGAGKTMLARELVKRYKNARYVHHGVYKDAWPHHLATLLLPHSRPLIIDRFYPSETIYGNVYRSQDTIGAKARMFERALLGRRAVLIMCRPPLDVCLASYRKRKTQEYLRDEESVMKVYRAYALYRSALDTLCYDFTAQTPKSWDHDGIMLALDAALAEQPVNRTSGIGLAKPGNILIVGDRPSGDYDLPFVGKGGSSEWLAALLNLDDVDERQLYWLNAYNDTGKPKARDFMHYLKPRLVIALGNEARRWCDQTHTPCVLTSHPQHWKRFHHHERYPLLDILKKETV